MHVNKYPLRRTELIINWLLAGRSAVWTSAKARDFLFSKTVQTGSGTHPALSYRGSIRALKRPGRAHHSPPSSAEVKNEWSYNSTPPACFYGVNRENFIIIIIIIIINQIIKILPSRNVYLHAPPTSNGSDVSTVFAKLSVRSCRITDSHQISYSLLQWPAGYPR
jgi:hypothetical protein